jgi:hypothetical protein
MVTHHPYHSSMFGIQIRPARQLSYAIYILSKCSYKHHQQSGRAPARYARGHRFESPHCSFASPKHCAPKSPAQRKSAQRKALSAAQVSAAHRKTVSASQRIASQRSAQLTRPVQRKLRCALNPISLALCQHQLLSAHYKRASQEHRAPALSINQG